MDKVDSKGTLPERERHAHKKRRRERDSEKASETMSKQYRFQRSRMRRAEPRLTALARRRRRGGGQGRRFARRARVQRDLFLDEQDPVMLQQFGGGAATFGVAVEAALEEVEPELAELLSRWQLRRLALRDVVHDGPLVVEVRPRSAAADHLEDDAA